MQTYELLVRNRMVVPNSNDMALVRTSVGIDQVHVMFDNPEWLEFPITITFAQGEEIVTQSLVVNAISGSDEWVAEATAVVPYEVIDMVGKVRVTLQGTDADGRHIVTAYGAPLRVEEAGDTVLGEIPSSAPTVDQWNQAYANAMAAANDAATLVASLQSQLDSMLSDAQAYIDQEKELALTPATSDAAGVVKIGNNINVTEDGTISVTFPASSGGSSSGSGMSTADRSALENLSRLAYYAFDTNFNSDGELQDDVKLKVSALPFMIADEVTY